MLATDPPEPAVPSCEVDPVADLLRSAARDARRLRALAFVALHDGGPRAEHRAANARAAARAVIAHARRLARIASRYDRSWSLRLRRHPAE
jgi:hypothetical protein